MHKPLILGVVGAALVAAGVIPAHAAEGVFYNPSNPASSTGKTVGHELFLTIGCPGRGLLEAPCARPTTAAVAATAPADRDGDGVVDSKDQCPNTPAGRKVNADGCELDSDKDGVVDGVDKCPTVYAKTADGCPPAPPKKLVLEGVNFANNQAVLQQDSYGVLDEAAATLKEWGDIRVEVAGHTDSVGKDSYNLVLSQRRAETVRQYLIGKGVAANRLVAKGYGEARPVADNATEAGRDKNRRVELVPLQ